MIFLNDRPVDDEGESFENMEQEREIEVNEHYLRCVVYLVNQGVHIISVLTLACSNQSK